MKVLVLGGYGLIGSVVCRHLLACGYAVTGLGRSTAMASRQMPGIEWVSADIATLTASEYWFPILQRVRPDAIVNCSGALQDGSRDRLADVQAAAMLALFTAAQEHSIDRFVQISAPRAASDASTQFMRTKGQADEVLAMSQLEWTILRPGLVIAPQAYGGTALLRALAAMPFVLPVTFGARPVQTVAATDIARAVQAVLERQVPNRQTYDLVEDETHTLGGVLRMMRGWLGLPPGREINVPERLVRLAARVADAFAWIGWRSPMRTTAIEEINAGVEGDPAPWRQASGSSLGGLAATLAAMPATVQERWFARLFFIKPLIVGTLSAFWLITGIITLANPEAAGKVLTAAGTDKALAGAVVYGGALVDIALGVAILIRRWTSAAALGMIAVTCAYLAGGTLLAPHLWLDPLGPLVKAVPAMMLALTALAVTQDR